MPWTRPSFDFALAAAAAPTRSPPWPGFLRALLALFVLRARTVALLASFCCAVGCPTGTFAQAPNATDSTLDAARAQIDALQKRLHGEVADADLQRMRENALALQASTEKTAADLGPALANVQARLAELGPKAASGPEAADVAEQRAALDKSRTVIDAQIRLARLLAVESEQTADQASTLRRSQFQARLGERTASILAGPFWTELRASLPRDLLRVRQLGAELSAAALATPAWAWLALAASTLALAVARALVGRLLLKVTASRVPAGRLRRSLLALATTLLAVVVPTFLAHGLRLALGWQSAPSPRLDGLLIQSVGVVSFGAFLAGLGQALLSARRPSWRLPHIPDDAARRVRRHPLWLALVIVLGTLLEGLATAVNAGLATAVAINCIFALALGGWLSLTLTRAMRLRRDDRARRSAHAGEGPNWVSGLMIAGWLMLVVSLVGLLVGYVALGSFLVKQVVWAATITATVYLLTTLIDDLCMTLVASSKADDDDTPMPPQLRNQAAVLLSAAARLTVLLLALVLVIAPFGQGPAELFQRADDLRAGITIGEIALRPTALLQAFAVFMLAIGCVKGLQRWLTVRYLPTTRLDLGMRTSATTLLGFVGTVVAAALALSSVGLGLERIAWVASALSVGIGFGLQAVVSNFVSGLILLAERPVKVGDWVSLGGVEGDIQRINVRATEIQMGDRSTVIVPNSEFITKTVRNVTHANPLGLVQIKLPMPLDTDVQQVHDTLLAAFTDHADVLAEPAPAVFIDGIEGAHLVFNATGSVDSPRKAYGVRSALLFDLLGRLRAAGLPLAKAPTVMLRDAAPSAVPAAPEEPSPPL